MSANENMAGWITAMRKYKLENLADAFSTIKDEDVERLERSGLPIARGLKLFYREFNEENKMLAKFLNECPWGVTTRIWSVDNKERKHEKGLKKFEECFEFLEKNKTRDVEYIVYLTEWEPEERSGIVISNPRKLRIGLSKNDLDKFSHGEDACFSATIDFAKVGHLENKTSFEVDGSEKDRKIMRKVLRYLELTRDSFNPLYKRGYFELVYTIKGNINFADYKINEMYLK